MNTKNVVVDKFNRLTSLGSHQPVSIELGCGNNKKNAQAIGIDALDFPDVDIVGDIFEVLSQFPAGSVAAVYAYHFVEHIPDLTRLLREVERVCAPNARIEFVAPHFSNPYFYSDPTHHNFFGLYTFCYFVESGMFRRSVPTYGANFQFKFEQVELIFKSDAKFPVRYGIKKAIGLLFNASTYLKEFYEENLCHFFPCYELKYVLIRR